MGAVNIELLSFRAKNHAAGHCSTFLLGWNVQVAITFDTYNPNVLYVREVSDLPSMPLSFLPPREEPSL